VSREWTEEFKVPYRYLKLEYQVVVPSMGESYDEERDGGKRDDEYMAFLVKSNGGAVEGTLGFIGVSLIPIEGS
jgi:hypothetical protein